MRQPVGVLVYGGCDKDAAIKHAAFMGYEVVDKGAYGEMYQDKEAK